MAAGEVSAPLPLPKLRWRTGQGSESRQGEIGRNGKPLTEVEVELARVKRELAVTRMARDILKNNPATFPRLPLSVAIMNRG